MKLIYLQKILEFYNDLGVDYVFAENTNNKLDKNLQVSVGALISSINNVNQSSVRHERVSVESSRDQIEKGIKDLLADSAINNGASNENFNISINHDMGKHIESLPEKSSGMVDNNLHSKKQAFILPIEAENIARKLADAADDLEKLRGSVENFEGCNLKKIANKTVFSDGNPNSDIMLIGEAPGADEDIQGIPFCGRSGKLLDEIFKAINLTRDENLYITNTVFWRPPGNRKPEPEEIRVCRPFVEKHIAIQKPKLIILVGSTAIASILPDISLSVTKMRGKVYDYMNQYLDHNIKVVVIFHPSYLLRQGMKKKDMWKDLLFIKKLLDE